MPAQLTVREESRATAGGKIGLRSMYNDAKRESTHAKMRETWERRGFVATSDMVDK